MRNGIKFYGVNNLASGHALKNAEDIIQSFDATRVYTDINKILELYNIKQYFDNEIYLISWDENTKNRYISTVKHFHAVIGKFYSQINSDNLLEYYEKVVSQYRLDYWDLIEYFGIYKKIDSIQFENILLKDAILRYILKCPKIVIAFSSIIAKELTNNLEYAETVLDYYIVKHTKQSRKMYMPAELTPENKKSILWNYINWEKANPNYLQLISTLKKCDDFFTDDRIRYAAFTKHKEYWAKESSKRNLFSQKIGACASFYDGDFSPEEKTDPDDHTLNLSYSTKWIKENLDYPTLLNNFIYLFGFVDEQCRYQHLANPSKLGVLERDFGVSGRNTYKTGIDYQLRKISSIVQMTGYLKQLEINNIKLEEIFKWFFEVYLVEEFGAEGFCYFVPSEQASVLEKILVLITQFDSIIKQYRIFIEDKKIDRDFFEFSSDYYKLSDTPSMIVQKYLYPQSADIKAAMDMMYSDQSMLYYVDENSHYNNLPHMLIERKMSVADFPEFDQPQIKWLLSHEYAFLDDEGNVKIELEKALILKDFFENGVISYPYYNVHHAPYKIQLEEWIESEDIVAKSSLFTIQEQEFIDYILNVQKFNNGPELRNKYAHGSFPKNINRQEQDYIELLRIMVLIIIKINEEFCVTNPQETKRTEQSELSNNDKTRIS